MLLALPTVENGAKASNIYPYTLASVRLLNFKDGGSLKIKIIFAKNQHTQMKTLYFVNTMSSHSQKVPKQTVMSIF